MSALAPIADEPEAFERVPPVGVKWHPYADVFPWIEGEAYEALKEDIAKNGVLEPVVFLDGYILDGRNRYAAARELGIDYPRVEYRGDDPLGYVISLNLRRRHLTESQRAIAASKLAKLPPHRPNNSEDNSANLRTSDAAKMLNVSTRSVETAKAVQRTGAPELVAKVETGAVSVSAAAEVAKLPIEEQQAVVEAGTVAIKDVAKVVRETGADAETAALRASVIEAAKQGLAPERKDRRNPLYEHDPVYRMLMRVVGPCRAMVEQVDRGEIVIAEALSGFLDDVPGQRDRDLSDIARARDFLSLFLETANAD